MEKLSKADQVVVKDESAAQARADAAVTKDYHDSISTAADEARNKITEMAREVMAHAEKEGHSAETAVAQFWAAIRREINLMGPSHT